MIIFVTAQIKRLQFAVHLTKALIEHEHKMG